MNQFYVIAVDIYLTQRKHTLLFAEFCTTRNEIEIYCGVAHKGRNIERPLLVNGYPSRNGFMGNR
jgi:hypothetical protein